MKVWLIEPHEPLIFREGKPFAATPGAHARSLPFPFPSTTAGAFRSQSHLNDSGVFELPEDNEERNKILSNLKAISVRGPLLVSLKPDSDEIEHWFVPAPADALLLNVEDNNEKEAIVRQLAPLAIKEDELTDFIVKQAGEQEALQVVGLPLDERESDLEKPYKNAPRYWYWSAFEQWLRSPSSSEQRHIAELGISGPTYETRVHVAMDNSTRAGKDGRLFDTSGLEFTYIASGKLSKANANAHPVEQQGSSDASTCAPGKISFITLNGSPLHRAQRLALALVTDEGEQIKEQLGTLGGERRLVSWRNSNDGLPSCPKEVKDQIIAEQRCRLFLLTPAYFSEGYRPTCLCQQQDFGVRPQLKAIAIQRPQVVSGWDLAAKPQRAKPSRRLAPAGTVLFLELECDSRLQSKEEKKAAIEKWIDQIWFSCISDDMQYRLDGFGLAVLGAWPIATGQTSIDKGGKA